MLDKTVRKGNEINLLGYFAPLQEGSDLIELLKSAGFAKIREISTCKTYEEFLDMSRANLNLVLNSEAHAEDMYEDLGIPYAELTRVYGIDTVRAQYKALGQVLGVNLDDSRFYDEARSSIDAFISEFKGASVNIGECINANPYELALSLTRYGLNVREIYATAAPEHMVYIKKLAELSPDTKLYCNLDPSMINYSRSEDKPLFTLGKDAAYYCPDAPNIPWNSDVQPYGYKGIVDLLAKIREEIR